MKKRLLSLLMALCMMLSMLPPTTFAADCSHTETTPVPGYGATCLAPGLTDGVQCASCGEWVIAPETIPAQHTIVDGICIVCGTLDGMDYSISGDEVTITRYLGSAQKVVIPATIAGKRVTKIGEAVFFDCDVKEVAIPDSVTEIGNDAFQKCHDLVKITLGNSITHIGANAFTACDALTEIKLPDTVTSIAGQAFNGCSKLEKINIPDGITYIRDDCFNRCDSLNYKAYNYGYYLGNEENPYVALIKPINSGIPSCEVHEKTKIIATHAFDFCTNLTKVVISDGVTSIGSEAFFDCSNLVEVVLGDSVTRIYNGAFEKCSSLAEITFPASITEIGSGAFWECGSLAQITFKGSAPEMYLRCFERVTATAYYPCNDSTWTKNKLQNYGGTITWVANHNFVDGVCTGCDAEEHPTVFADIPSDSWQYPFAVYAVRNGLMAGKGTDADGNIKFDPNSPITREEFVQVLYNAEGKPAISIANPFPDVADGGWYKNAVLWAKQNDIASGKGNGSFGVGENISRQDLAMMLYKYAKLNGYSLDATEGLINGYADGAAVADYAKIAMDWAVSNGIMSGKGTAGADLSTFRLDPTGIATRAECAAMLKNFKTAFEG